MSRPLGQAMIRTPQEAYEAGRRAAEDAPPLTAEQVTALALLLAAHRPEKARAA